MAILALSAAGTIEAQELFVTPGANTNVVGSTPDAANVPDYLLKQQQEPACVVSIANDSYIFCTYNDLRASDNPSIQGDAWIGASMSGDGGKTWFSRLAPGFLGHPNSIGQGFAADPGLVAIPGHSPGLAIMSFIAGNRGENEGVLAVQRWVENPQEDRNFWLAEDAVRTPISGSGGRFVDKSAILYIPDKVDVQTTISQQVFVEGQAEPINVTTPSGTIVIMWAVFTGSHTSKIYSISSRDNGITWTNPTKLSEGTQEVTGVVATSIEDLVVAAWRQRKDSSSNDAIVGVVSTDGGNRWGKVTQFMSLCPFDQPASSFSFRSFDFPWLANDGERFYMFAADRRYTGDNSCADQAAPNPPGTYSGKPHIVGMTSVNGKNWVGTANNKNEPFVLNPNAAGFSFMPVSRGTKGWVDVAYYSTEREEPLPYASDNPFPYLVTDYIGGGVARVSRKADVMMTRLRSAASCGTQPNAGCDVNIEEPVRVSQYQFVLDEFFIEGDDISEVGQEIEAHQPNWPLYASGTLAFKGDYIAMATPGLRELQSGKYIQNSFKEGARGAERPGFLNSQDVVIAWGDNRDVRAPSFSGPQMPYTPPEPPAGSMAYEAFKRLNRTDPESGEALLADSTEPQYSFKAVTEPDDDPMLPPDTSITTCSVQDFSRARDANVYMSLVKDEPSVNSSILTKPLGTIQRMFPIQLTNPDLASPKTFCVVIDNQPPDAPVTGRASFYQLPAIPPFGGAIPPLTKIEATVATASTASRAVFVVTSDPTTIINVNAYEQSCDVPLNEVNRVGTLQLADGNLFDPEYCAVPIPPERQDACQSVAFDETHNITLVSPGLQADVLTAPGFQASGTEAVTYASPGFQAPGFQAPGFQFPGFQAPGFQFPGFQAPGFQFPGFQAPGFQAPGFQAPGFQAATFGDENEPDNTNPIVMQDVTYVVSADANVTTTYSADIALSGLDPDNTVVQLVAWTPNAYATAKDCQTVPTANQQILAHTTLFAPGFQAVSLPETITPGNQNPYAGAISFTQTPGTYTAITARVWAVGTAREVLKAKHQEYLDCKAEGDPDVCDPANAGIAQLLTFAASSQSCNTNALPDPNDPNPSDCLNSGNEKIFQDRFGPQISPADGTAVSFEADSPAGADISTPGFVPTFVSANDPSGVDSLTCTSADFALVDGTSTVPFSTVDNGELVPATIDCTAIDGLNNEATASIGIIVTDNIAPVLTVSADITQAPDSASGAAVTYVVTATDNIDTNVDISCDWASGSVFPIGVTTVTCTASDDGPNASAGVNTVTGSFMVTIVDSDPPVINGGAALPDVTFEATAVSTPVTLTEPPVSDVDPNPAISNDVGGLNPSLPLGTTVVTWTVTDFSLNSSTATQNVIVQDTMDPVITVPADITEIAHSSSGKSVNFNVTATDIFLDTISCVDQGSGMPVQSGDNFAIGDTVVECTATDTSGNSASDSFVVTIKFEYGVTGIGGAKPNAKTGTSIPLYYAWLVNGVPADVSGGSQTMTVYRHANIDPDSNECVGGQIVVNPDPGSSGFQMQPDFSWQFNFQANLASGDPLPIDGASETYCLTVRLTNGLVSAQPQSGLVKLRANK